MDVALEGTQDADVVGVETGEPPVAAHHHCIHRPDHLRQRINLVQVAQDGLLVGGGDAEAGQSVGFQAGKEILQVGDFKGKVNGVQARVREGGVVHGRRKRVQDGLPDDAIDAGAGVELGSAVTSVQLAPAKLPRRGWRADIGSGVGERTAGAQRKHPARNSHCAHRQGHHPAAVAPSQLQHANRVAVSAGQGGNLYQLTPQAFEATVERRQVGGRALEIVPGDDAPRVAQKHPPQPPGESLQRGGVHVHPAAAGTHGQLEQGQLGRRAAAELAAVGAPAAGGNQSQAARPPRQLLQHGHNLGDAAQVVQPQLDHPRGLFRPAQRCPERRRGALRHHQGN